MRLLLLFQKELDEYINNRFYFLESNSKSFDETSLLTQNNDVKKQNNKVGL